jgi:hypothetical protein
MSMKIATAAFAFVLTLGFLVPGAQANLILSPSSPNPPLILTGPEPGTPSTAAILAYLNGLGYDLTNELYKQDRGAASDSGQFASSYTTTFNADASGGLITWDGGDFISGSPIYLLVKDGNRSPIWYLFDIGEMWNGQQTIELQGFWPAGGAISHVSIYGRVSVPDGGATLMLLGGVLVGLEVLRRKMQSNS